MGKSPPRGKIRISRFFWGLQNSGRAALREQKASQRTSFLDFEERHITRNILAPTTKFLNKKQDLYFETS